MDTSIIGSFQGQTFKERAIVREAYCTCKNRDGQPERYAAKRLVLGYPPVGAKDLRTQR